GLVQLEMPGLRGDVALVNFGPGAEPSDPRGCRGGRRLLYWFHDFGHLPRDVRHTMRKCAEEPRPWSPRPARQSAVPATARVLQVESRLPAYPVDLLRAPHSSAILDRPPGSGP